MLVASIVDEIRIVFNTIIIKMLLVSLILIYFAINEYYAIFDETNPYVNVIKR